MECGAYKLLELEEEIVSVKEYLSMLTGEVYVQMNSPKSLELKILNSCMHLASSVELHLLNLYLRWHNSLLRLPKRP